MVSRLFFCLIAFPGLLSAQVFMRPVDNSVTLALGGAVVAYPGTETGLSNDAVLGFGKKAGIFLGSALPYGIGSWQSAHFQGFIRLGQQDGIGLDVTHSAIEAYGEQRFRLLYGRRLGEKFLLGGSADVMRVSAQEYGSATTAGFGISLLANPLPNVWLGARVQNPLQLDFGGAVIPTVLRLGAAWEAASTLLLLLETEKDLERPAQIRAGIEYRPMNVLTLRIGLRTEPARLGFGAGLRLTNGLAIHTGAEWHTTLGFTPTAMLVWRKD